MFRAVHAQLSNYSNAYIQENLIHGLKSEQISELSDFFGKNSVEISETPLTNIIIDEITSPYFVFPILSCVIWLLEYYQIYACVVLSFTVFSVLLNISSETKNVKRLRNMSLFKQEVTVYRNVEGCFKETYEELRPYQQIMPSEGLLPGDLVQIPENYIMPADMVLLNGTCIMDEHDITGESAPVMKTALPYDDKKFNSKEENKVCMIYAGTKCLETRYYKKDKVPILGLVYETGFNTLKGQLIRAVVFPKPSLFNFYRDSLKFIWAMFVISLFGVVWTVYIYHQFEAFSFVEELVFDCLDMITVVIPPALPTCMSFGIAFALYRLRKTQIYCTSPAKINVAGKIDVLLFDKAGTLDSEPAKILGVISISGSFSAKTPVFREITDVKVLSTEFIEETRSALIKNLSFTMRSSLFTQTKKPPHAILLESLACCHSLTRVHEKLTGDTLDIRVFEETGWVLEENLENFDDFLLAVVYPTEFSHEKAEKTDFNKVKQQLYSNATANQNVQVGIIRRFAFSSRLQRMSVIVKSLHEKKFRVHVKGAPEKLRELCKPRTIPENYHETLEKYSREGFRVLAYASRSLPTSVKELRSLDREDIEQKLVFLGFLITENRINPVTSDVISQVNAANLRSLMVTGDNILTAISVAKKIGLVSAPQRVYFAEIIKENSQMEVIRWRDFDCFDNTLDPVSLKAAGKEKIQREILFSEMNESKNENKEGNTHNFFAESLKLVDSPDMFLKKEEDVVVEKQKEQDFIQNNESKSPENSAGNLENLENLLSLPTNEEFKLLASPNTTDRNPFTTKKSHFSNKTQPNVQKLLPKPSNLTTINPISRITHQISLQSHSAALRISEKTEKIEQKNPEDLLVRTQILGRSPRNMLPRNTLAPGTLQKHQARWSFNFKSSQIYKIIMREDAGNESNEGENWANLKKNQDFSLAISGNVFRFLLKKRNKDENYVRLFTKMLRKTQIFARMLPKDKASLVQELQKTFKNSVVGMFGDGLNDCAALSKADVGVALSESEASIAAPFTSKVRDISCILQLLK